MVQRLATMTKASSESDDTGSRLLTTWQSDLMSCLYDIGNDAAIPGRSDEHCGGNTMRQTA